MTFGYHRAVAPMMWVLVAISAVECLVVHTMIALLWSRWIALALSAMTIGGMIWLIGVIAAMRRCPVSLDGERLVMRVGTLKRAEVAVANIAGLRREWDRAAMKDRQVLNLALIAYPNVVVDLVEKLPGRRGIRSIAHRLDDPVAFTAAIERLVAAR